MSNGRPYNSEQQEMYSQKNEEQVKISATANVSAQHREGGNIPKLNLRKFMKPGNLSLNYINSDSTMSTPTRCDQRD